MTVEVATYISSLNASLPTGADTKSEGDDHLRLLKSTLLASFPGIAGALTATHTQLNKIVSALSVASAPAAAITIDASGNVGVGTSAPTLTAVNRGNVSTNGATDSVYVLQISGATAAYLYAGSNRVELDASGARWLQINTSGVERLRVDANGNTVKTVNSSAPALGSNSQMVFSLPSNTTLRVSVRGADGVTRTADIALA